jgi:23S rRNA U2552 (ribose-2'-O)-methylase RlmE/FtsJ
VTILQGDFLSPSVQEQLAKAIAAPPTKTTRSNPSFLAADNPPPPRPIDRAAIRVDTVLSDMMANMSGIRARDIEASLELCEMALHFSRGRLKSGLTKATEEDAEGKRMLALKDYKGNMLCVSPLFPFGRLHKLLPNIAYFPSG